eukprot:3833728-Rhodomonas_salina.1
MAACIKIMLPGLILQCHGILTAYTGRLRCAVPRMDSDSGTTNHKPQTTNHKPQTTTNHKPQTTVLVQLAREQPT